MRTGETVQWIGSNCECGDAVSRTRQFIDSDCDFFEMPYTATRQVPTTPWKRTVFRGVKPALDLVSSTRASSRARKYTSYTRNAEVVNFHQILAAYGSRVVFNWLELPMDAARVVTIHEFDDDQLASPAVNKGYNKADAVIVLSGAMRDRLIEFGVQPEKVHVVLHGTIIPDPSNDKREGLVFYGGHKIMGGKGLDTVLKAMAIIQDRRRADAPRLTINGHYGTATPAAAEAMAKDLGVDDLIVWRNQIPERDMFELYQKSMVCLLPFTASFGGLAAAAAAACGLPVIATRQAGIPDYLGDTGIWVEENNPDELATRIIELLDDPAAWQAASDSVRKRAEQLLSWDLIAANTLQVFERAVAGKAGGGAAQVS